MSETKATESPAQAPTPAEAAAPAAAQPFNLHKITFKKTNRFIMNSQNTDILIDGVYIKGVKEIGFNIKASDVPGQAAIAEATIRLYGYLTFEEPTVEEQAATEAKAKAEQEEMARVLNEAKDKAEQDLKATELNKPRATRRAAKNKAKKD